MPIKCILACKDELLGSIIKDLLKGSEGLELTDMMGKSDLELIDALEKNQPEVLILCKKTHDTMPINYLGMLQKFPTLLIISVSTDENYMHIYSKQKVLINQSSDLLSVIQSQ